jgi:hypothetical protein
MKLLTRYRPKSNPAVLDVRRQLNAEVDKLEDLLDQVQYQVEIVKEELENERGAE